MANEIYVLNSLRIVKGNLNFQPPPQAFYANMLGYKGPTPGSITVGLHVTTVNLSQLTLMGGMCVMINTDPTNYVSYGPYDPAWGKWLPFGKILPGEAYQLRLSDELGQEVVTGTGTHPIGSGVQFAMKANGAPCDVIVYAFDA